MFERFVERRAEEALSDTPVVLIVGPRRVGTGTVLSEMSASRCRKYRRHLTRRFAAATHRLRRVVASIDVQPFGSRPARGNAATATEAPLDRIG